VSCIYSLAVPRKDVSWLPFDGGDVVAAVQASGWWWLAGEHLLRVRDTRVVVRSSLGDARVKEIAPEMAAGPLRLQGVAFLANLAFLVPPRADKFPRCSAGDISF